MNAFNAPCINASAPDYPYEERDRGRDRHRETETQRQRQRQRERKRETKGDRRSIAHLRWATAAAFDAAAAVDAGRWSSHADENRRPGTCNGHWDRSTGVASTIQQTEIRI